MRKYLCIIIPIIGFNGKIGISNRTEQQTKTLVAKEPTIIAVAIWWPQHHPIPGQNLIFKIENNVFVQLESHSMKCLTGYRNRS